MLADVDPSPAMFSAARDAAGGGRLALAGDTAEDLPWPDADRTQTGGDGSARWRVPGTLV